MIRTEVKENLRNSAIKAIKKRIEIIEHWISVSDNQAVLKQLKKDLALNQQSLAKYE